MDQNALRNFKDFLQLYNYMSHSCFQHCVNNFNSRDLHQDEADCVELCIRKHIKVNHKVMGVFTELQPAIINKRIEEMNKTAELIEQQAAAAQVQGLDSQQQAISATSS